MVTLTYFDHIYDTFTLQNGASGAQHPKAWLVWDPREMVGPQSLHWEQGKQDTWRRDVGNPREKNGVQFVLCIDTYLPQSAKC